jgi:hypothetical protein
MSNLRERWPCGPTWRRHATTLVLWTPKPAAVLILHLHTKLTSCAVYDHAQGQASSPLRDTPTWSLVERPVASLIWRAHSLSSTRWGLGFNPTDPIHLISETLGAARARRSHARVSCDVFFRSTGRSRDRLRRRPGVSANAAMIGALGGRKVAALPEQHRSRRVADEPGGSCAAVAVRDSRCC